MRDQAYRDLDVSGGVRWMSDSRRLLVNNDGEFTIVDAQTGRRRPILSLKDRRMGNQFWGFSLSRDDRRLALVTDDVEGDLWITSR